MNEKCIIANGRGEYFQRFGFLGRAKYVPHNVPEYALHFRAKEEAEDFIKRKNLDSLHHPVSIK